MTHSDSDIAIQRRNVQYAVSQVVAEAATIDDATPRLLQVIGEGLGWDFGAFWMLNAHTNVAYCTTTWHVPTASCEAFEQTTRRATFGPGDGLPGRVWASGMPAWIADVIPDENFPRAAVAAQDGLHGAFAFPVRLGHSIFGIIEFFSRAILPPDPDLIQLVVALGSQIGQFIERKQTDAALQKSEARKMAMFETALDGIITIDHGGKVLEWNPAAARIFGYRAAEAVGHCLEELIIPVRLRELHRRGIAHYLATGEGPAIGKRIEMPALRADGTEFPVELAITRIPSDGPPAFTGYIRDITERKRAEQERDELLAREQAAHAEAQEAIRMRDVFLSVAAHELKTPLTALLGHAQMIKRRVEREHTTSERNLRALHIVVDQANRLNKMISALLDISRLETGQLSIEHAPVNLGMLTARIVAEVQPALEHHTLVYCGPEEPLIIVGDELRLEQVLQNLIQNAIKYSPHGGLVSVQVLRHEMHACVSVTDQGIGIPAQALAHLFQRFYRADNVHGNSIQGMGLGLFVVKEIVALHGGHITVDSVEGAGSTFTVYLPLDQQVVHG